MSWAVLIQTSAVSYFSIDSREFRKIEALKKLPIYNAWCSPNTPRDVIEFLNHRRRVAGHAEGKIHLLP